MSCECANMVCVDVFLSPCAATIQLPVTADETAVWNMAFEFNGSQFVTSVPVYVNQPIVIPNRFNEQYTHVLRFYRPDNTVFLNTCFKLTTMPTVFAPASVPAPAAKETYALPMFQTTEAADYVIPALHNAEILSIEVEEFTATASFNNITNTLTITSDFGPGQSVKILYKK